MGWQFKERVIQRGPGKAHVRVIKNLKKIYREGQKRTKDDLDTSQKKRLEEGGVDAVSNAWLLQCFFID